MIFDEFLTSSKESLILCAFTVLTDNVKLSEVIKKRNLWGILLLVLCDYAANNILVNAINLC
jgi:hypothetical protein